MAPCVVLLILSLWKFPFGAQLVLATNWGNQLAIVSIGLCMYLGGKDQPRTTPVAKREGLISAVLLTMEFGLALQIIIFLVYWPFVHPYVLIDILPLNDSVIYWVMIFIHTWPFVEVVINVILTRTVFIYDHYKICL